MKLSQVGNGGGSFKIYSFSAGCLKQWLSYMERLKTIPSYKRMFFHILKIKFNVFHEKFYN